MFDSPDSTDIVELVGQDGEPIGSLEKLAAHRAPGRLHRGFSVFLFDDAGRLLLQRRAGSKYHFGGRWSNACCGHPAPGSDVVAAAQRRVRDELRLDAALEVVGSFRYRAEDAASGLVEHEDDTVLLGRIHADDAFEPNPDEVSETRWIALEELRDALRVEPASFTPWLAEALDHVAGVLPPRG